MDYDVTQMRHVIQITEERSDNSQGAVIERGVRGTLDEMYEDHWTMCTRILE